MESGIMTGMVFVVVLSVLHQTSAVDKIITSPNIGSVKGQTVDVSIDSSTIQIAEYFGIPYAEPPTGQLRFAKPQPKARFDVMFEASEYGPACFQAPPMYAFAGGNSDIMDEDCLSLNIHAPVVGGGILLPVMVFIHGGGFAAGEAKYFRGHILAAYGEVVVVTMNYRLGPLGFLSTEDQHAPGNAGLWDQRLAIKWVKDNIEAFGGNSSRITLFGESAGSSSVNYQVLHKENIGLFQNAIMESGSHRAVFAFSNAGQNLAYAKTLATKLNCDTESNMNIVKCLRDLPALEIQLRGAEILTPPNLPRIDEDFVTSDVIAAVEWPRTEKSSTMNPSHNFNMIIGTNGYEGHFLMVTFLSTIVDQLKNATIPQANAIYKSLLQLSLPPLGFSSSDSMINALMFQYSNAANPKDRILLLREISHFFTDTWFFVDCSKDVHSHSYTNNNTATYQYEFNINPKLKDFPGSDWMDGNTHAEELLFVFGWSPSLKLLFNFTEDERQANWPISKVVMDYWTNFAKTGNPNQPRNVPAQWKKFTLDSKDYLYFPSKGNPRAEQFLNAKRLAFWEEYVPKLVNMEATAAPPGGCQETSPGSIIEHSLFVIILVAFAVITMK